MLRIIRDSERPVRETAADSSAFRLRTVSRDSDKKSPLLLLVDIAFSAPTEKLPQFASIVLLIGVLLVLPKVFFVICGDGFFVVVFTLFPLL